LGGENDIYVAEVRRMACVARDLGHCMGRIEAHHAGDKGYGQKAHDETCVPLCLLHHRNWHDASGIFRDVPKEWRRRWIADQIAYTQRKLGHVRAEGESR
jgi:hypothetical protein